MTSEVERESETALIPAKADDDSLEESGKRAEKEKPPTPSIYPRTCKKCSTVFKNRHAFWNHRVVCSGAVIICEDCSHVYRSRLAFYEHKCQKRKTGQGCKRLTKCIAPDCESKFFRRTEMLKHMEAVHLNNINDSTLSFTSVEDFEKWKESESQKNFTYFRKQRGTKRLKGTEYSSFVCQFDAPNRKKGSKIPNYSCPARMQVSKNEKGEVSVRYISTHNHSLTRANLKFHPYSKTVVNYIKELLINGVTPKTVFKILKRKTDDPDFLQLKDHSITVKYINNIKYQLKVKGELKDNPTSSKCYHKDGIDIAISSVISLSDSTWLIVSSQDQNSNCVVEKYHLDCPEPDNCLYRCNYSVCQGLCSHMYSCSCSNGSLCKHIHRVQSLCKRINKSPRKILKINKTKQHSRMEIIVEEDDFVQETLNYPVINGGIPIVNSKGDENVSYSNDDNSLLIDMKSTNDEVIKNVYSVPEELIQIEYSDTLDDVLQEDEIPNYDLRAGIMSEQEKEEESRSAGEDLLVKLSNAFKRVSSGALPQVNRVLENALKELSELC